MKPLGNTYKKNTFFYKLIKRVDNVAIFKQTTNEEHKGCLAYEVIVVKQNPEYIMAGNVIPAHESCPGNEEWGRLGWTYDTLERAENKLNEIVNREKHKKKNKK